MALVAAGLLCLATYPGKGLASLPEGLSTPDQRVVCNTMRGACYDRLGPSIGLTQIFLGREAAENLTAVLRHALPPSGVEPSFSPAPGVECVRETGPCRALGAVHEGLTAVLFGPWPETRRDAEVVALLGVDWKWLGTRYNDDTSTKPDEPSHYTLRLSADGSVQARLDCNRAGGQYRLEAHRLTVELTHSTMAACEPGSLDTIFRKDLARTGTFFLKDGRLYVDLSYDSGTMEFGR